MDSGIAPTQDKKKDKKGGFNSTVSRVKMAADLIGEDLEYDKYMQARSNAAGKMLGGE